MFLTPKQKEIVDSTASVKTIVKARRAGANFILNNSAVEFSGERVAWISFNRGMQISDFDCLIEFLTKNEMRYKANRQSMSLVILTGRSPIHVSFYTLSNHRRRQINGLQFDKVLFNEPGYDEKAFEDAFRDFLHTTCDNKASETIVIGTLPTFESTIHFDEHSQPELNLFTKLFCLGQGKDGVHKSWILKSTFNENELTQFAENMSPRSFETEFLGGINTEMDLLEKINKQTD
jgi:hypothetical protein